MGVTVVDLDIRITRCDGDTVSVYRLRKELGGTASTEEVTEAEFTDLYDDARIGQSQFDLDAEVALGAWYTSLGTSAKATLRSMFADLP